MLPRLSLGTGKRRFHDLSEQEVLALAISSEEEDGKIYAAYAAKLRAQYPASAAVFDGMAAEERRPVSISTITAIDEANHADDEAQAG